MSSLILISGEEDFLMERAAKQEATISLVSEVIEYTFPEDLELYLRDSQLQLVPTGHRVFILWKIKEIPNLPESDQDTLICVSTPGKRVLQDKRAKRSLVFPKLKAYSDNNEVIKWILKEGQFFNIDLSRVAGALFVNSGTCLRKLHSEIEKISVVVSPGTVVSPEDARSIMIFSAEITPREIVNAVCDGHTTRALAYYDKLQERADETGWIIAYMQRHILQQLKLKESIEQNLPHDRIAELLSVHPFILKKMVETKLDLWSKKSLMLSFDTFCDLDIANKSGDQSVYFGLESEIIRMSEEVRCIKH